MEKETKKAALQMCDLHRKYINNYETGSEGQKIQSAYYRGLIDMLEIIISEYHKNGLTVARHKSGKQSHYIFQYR